MAHYNNIGGNYNHTRKADPYIVDQIETMLIPKAGMTYLDIGCGTGNYTIALTDRGTVMQGVDPSEMMLLKAKSKRIDIEWTIANAENLPFANEHFNGAIATLTIHHWADLELGFTEIFRTLRPGSNLVVFTAIKEQMENYWLCHYFPEMMHRSIAQMPALLTIKDAAFNSGFGLTGERKYFIQNDLQDLFLYSGKNAPSLYLDDQVRQNISSFASLADRREVADGLAKLHLDMTSKAFDHIKSSYDDQNGDYLFLRFTKP